MTTVTNPTNKKIEVSRIKESSDSGNSVMWDDPVAKLSRKKTKKCRH